MEHTEGEADGEPDPSRTRENNPGVDTSRGFTHNSLEHKIGHEGEEEGP